MERKTIATAFRHAARRKIDGEQTGNQGVLLRPHLPVPPNGGWLYVAVDFCNATERGKNGRIRPWE